MLPDICLELGLNHNGSVETAKKMVDMGLECARTVGYPLDKVFFKLQKRDPRVSTPRDMWDVPRVSPVSGNTMPYIEYKEEIEFGLDEYRELTDYASECGGLFASVWDLPSVEFVKNNFPDWPYIKIPSAHLTNETLVRTASRLGIPVILSTGMSTKDEIRDAVRASLSDATDLTILSCTASYPCKDSEVSFWKIEYLLDAYSEPSHIGFSSHSTSPFIPIYSNFYYVDMIEVHVTLDRAMRGSDHAASLERPAVQLLFRETMRIPELLGEYGTFIYDSELKKRKELRGY